MAEVEAGRESLLRRLVYLRCGVVEAGEGLKGWTVESMDCCLLKKKKKGDLEVERDIGWSAEPKR